VFAYTTVDNVIERPDGVKMGACFIASILLVSIIPVFIAHSIKSWLLPTLRQRFMVFYTATLSLSRRSLSGISAGNSPLFNQLKCCAMLIIDAEASTPNW